MALKHKIGASLVALVLLSCVGLAKIHIGKGRSQALNITTTSLPAGQTTVAYSATVSATGGTKPYTFTIGAGSLPTGLSLATSGAISGTPTVANTFNFTVHVVDSAGSPATDDQTLSIVIAATAPVTPVSITTSSIPSGTVSISYSTSLAASGGTLPYTWSTSSGFTPPGIVLASTGVISGTPTAPGTYSFTARVTDSTSPAQTYDKSFAISVAAGAATYIFTDGFESTNFSAWDYVNIGDGSYPPTVVCGGLRRSGNCSAQFHYYICGDSTNPACVGGVAHQDANRWVAKYFNSSNGYSNGLDHFFTRGYVYFQSPAPGATKDAIQRKIYYFLSDPNYSFILTSDGYQGQHKLRFSTNGDIYTDPYTLWDIAFLNYDQWYCLEFEVLLNTPGLSDGRVTLWVNGTQTYQKTGIILRSSFTSGISEIRVGQQADRGNWEPVDELRYWDDVVINSSYVGP